MAVLLWVLFLFYQIYNLISWTFGKIFIFIIYKELQHSPILHDVSEWNAQPWYSTGGTRAKKYLQGPDGKYYYFKRSQFKPGKDYRFEFWSEIIASKIGRPLGLNVLNYDIAIDGEVMGCISKSMIDPDKEELIEGIKYLQAYDNTFNPENVKQRNVYTFQLIEKALKQFNLGAFLRDIIEIIVFDAIIGNSDRHQENWALINEYTVVSKSLTMVEKEVREKGFEKLPKFIKRIYKRFVDQEKNQFNFEGTKAKLTFHKPKSASPIYDNGSSLGRELTESKVTQLLQNQKELNIYINRGTSEIHWENAKLDHFSLIKKILDSSHGEVARDVLRRVLYLYDETKIATIVNGIDNLVPESLSYYKLPDDRKQLIIKMITLRVEKLKELGNERI